MNKNPQRKNGVDLVVIRSINRPNPNRCVVVLVVLVVKTITSYTIYHLKDYFLYKSRNCYPSNFLMTSNFKLDIFRSMGMGVLVLGIKPLPQEVKRLGAQATFV